MIQRGCVDASEYGKVKLVFMVFVLLKANAILGNGCMISEQNYIAQLQESEIFPGLLYDFNHCYERWLIG